MTDNTEAAAQAVETPAAAPEFKTRAVPSDFPKEPEAPKEEASEQPDKPAEAAPEQAETPGDEASPDNPDEPEAEDNPDERKPLPKGVQRKINKLTRRLGESAEKIRELEEQLQAKGQVQEKPPEAKPQGEPKLEDFDWDTAAFNRAHYQWMREQEKRQEQITQRQRKFQEQESAFMADHPDYEEVTKSPDVPFTEQLVAVILDAENPPAVAYHLGKHPEEAERIAKLGPVAQARAIGRIEAALEAPPKAPEPLPKKTTTAPPPPKTVTGAGKPEVSVDDPNLTTAQRIALWRKQAG